MNNIEIYKQGDYWYVKETCKNFTVTTELEDNPILDSIIVSTPEGDFEYECDDIEVRV